MLRGKKFRIVRRYVSGEGAKREQLLMNVKETCCREIKTGAAISDRAAKASSGIRL